ncbi:MAG: DUF4054 domain-containing protein [Hyphomonas sp.]|jgi:hypothetical protein|uniref:DUF4054 domain-containing protein n=1 Tax=Hyphomonas sp. TaxID=87 RepID=UPI003266D752
MAYTAATATTLKARFPAFADVTDAVIEAALVRARRVVDDSWLADDRQEAEHLHAAHEMTMEGLGSTNEAQLAGFKKLKLGTLELERDTSTANYDAPYGQTTFGQRFRDILRRNHPGILAIGG